MNTTLNPIDALKKAVVDHVANQPFFSNITVIADDQGDVDTQIAVALSEIGLGVVFEANEGRVRFQAVGSGHIDLTPTFTITENVLINRDPENARRTGKTASDVVVNLFDIFNPLASRDPLPITLQEFEVVNNTGSVITYQITGRAQLGWTSKQ